MYSHQELVKIYINIYKDIHGIKPTWLDFDKMSIEDLQDDLNLLDAELRYHNDPIPTHDKDVVPVNNITSAFTQATSHHA